MSQNRKKKAFIFFFLYSHKGKVSYMEIIRDLRVKGKEIKETWQCIRARAFSATDQSYEIWRFGFWNVNK